MTTAAREAPPPTRTMATGLDPDGSGDAIVPIPLSAAAAILAALTAVPLVTVAGRLTEDWQPATRTIGRVGDGAAYGALIGLAVGAALLVTHLGRSPTSATTRLVELLAPPMAGALIGAVMTGVAWLADVRRGELGSLTLSLASSVAFGAAVAAAAHLGQGSARAATAAVGGASAGFFVWLAAYAMHDMVTVSSSLAYWRDLAHDPVARPAFTRYALGACLPAMCVPLGVAGADAVRRLWRR